MVIGIVVVSCASFAVFLVSAVSASYWESEPYALIASKIGGMLKFVGTKASQGALDVVKSVAHPLRQLSLMTRRSRSQDVELGGTSHAPPTNAGAMSFAIRSE